MEFTVKHKYIVLPVNVNMTSKKVCITSDDAVLFDFDCKIDTISPNYTAYVDISRFMGKNVKLTITPYLDVDIKFSDTKELEGLWREPLRPKVHFTVENGYNNDPNGLIFHNGVYHMFYQHNPCSPQWGNMHWGHATSPDLIHWTEQDCALYPDQMGTMFSGCAIEDTENLTGLGENGKPPMLLYYTAAGNESILSKDEKFTQCLAYSNDDGKSFKKYMQNPIIEFVTDHNRDPKVVWVDEMRKYVMVVYLSENLYRMLTSVDLLNWNVLKDIHIRNERECPDLYLLKCGNERKWVISGASDYYIIGRFTPNAFIAESVERKLTYSKTTYAAQSFSGMSDGRVVRICWNKNRTRFFSHRFSQQMGIPVSMQLEKIDERYYLSALPVEEISLLYKQEYRFENAILSDRLRWDIGCHPLDIILKMPYVDDANITISVYGANIVLETGINALTFGSIKMPIGLFGDGIDVRIIVDTCSLEVFTDHGRFLFTEWNVCDFNFPYVEVTTSTPAKIDQLSCYVLKSIHE